MARIVSLAFQQKVCGFDLLRSEKGRSYVCDVNGWSFVKSSTKYYDDCAGILRSIILVRPRAGVCGERVTVGCGGGERCCSWYYLVSCALALARRR